MIPIAQWLTLLDAAYVGELTTTPLPKITGAETKMEAEKDTEKSHTVGYHLTTAMSRPSQTVHHHSTIPHVEEEQINTITFETDTVWLTARTEDAEALETPAGTNDSLGISASTTDALRILDAIGAELDERGIVHPSVARLSHHNMWKLQAEIGQLPEALTDRMKLLDLDDGYQAMVMECDAVVDLLERLGNQNGMCKCHKCIFCSYNVPYSTYTGCSMVGIIMPDTAKLPSNYSYPRGTSGYCGHLPLTGNVIHIGCAAALRYLFRTVLQDPRNEGGWRKQITEKMDLDVNTANLTQMVDYLSANMTERKKQELGTVDECLQRLCGVCTEEAHTQFDINCLLDGLEVCLSDHAGLMPFRPTCEVTVGREPVSFDFHAPTHPSWYASKQALTKRIQLISELGGCTGKLYFLFDTAQAVSGKSFLVRRFLGTIRNEVR